jgi:Fe2+ or Zn2+ uptake regulation protein
MEPTPSEQFAEYRLRQGRKVTAPMSRVVDACFSEIGTFDVEAVVKQLDKVVARATVYRTIAGLTEMRLLRTVRGGRPGELEPFLVSNLIQDSA